MHYYKREDGFSLVEVLLATLILCAVIPLTNYFINSMKTNNKTELQQTANYVAQKYMEEYKAKSLNEYATIDNAFVDADTELYVNIEVVLDEPIDPFAGSMSVTGYFGGSIDIGLGSLTYSGATDGDTLVLRISADGTDEKLILEKTDGTLLLSTKLKPVTPASADRLISINLEEEQQLTLNVINSLLSNRWVVIKIENPCPNFILNNEGKVSLTTNELTTESGARITVTVRKDSDPASEILAKATQARKI